MEITLSSIISIGICVIILAYINMVESHCGKCTRIRETNIVKIFTVIILIRNVMMMVLPKESSMFLLKHPLFVFAIIIIGLVNIVAIYKFVNKMMSNQCRTCTADWKRTFLYYYSRIAIALIVIDFLIVIGMSIWISTLSPREMKKLQKQLEKASKDN